jgi:hypothetical protein
MKFDWYGLLKVAIYIALSGAITALLSWLGALDLTDAPTMAVVVVGVINLILKALKDAIAK